MMSQREAVLLLQRLLRQDCKCMRISDVNPLSRYIHYTPVRSMVAVKAKPRKAAATKKQTWRKTRKKIGPTSSKTVEELDAEMKAEQQNQTMSESPEGTTTTTEASNDTDNNNDTDGDDTTTTHWVPPAYRGLVDKTSGNSNRWNNRSRFETQKIQGGMRPRKIRKSKSEQYVLDNKGEEVVDVPILGLPEKAVIAKRQKTEYIKTSMEELKSVATSYRKSFRHEVKEESEANDIDMENEATTSSKGNNNMHQEIVSSLKSIHGTGTALFHDHNFEQTKADFDSICRLLRQICSTACSLSSLRKYNDRDATQYIDLAEVAMIELVQLISDRTNISMKHNKEDEKLSATESKNVENVDEQKDTMQRITEFMQIVNSSNDDLKKNEKDGSMTKWFNDMIERISPIVKKVESSQSKLDQSIATKKFLVNGDEIASAKKKDKKDSVPFGKQKANKPDSKDVEENSDDAMIQSIKRILRVLLSCIESTTKKPDVPLSASNLAIEVEDYEKVGQRMVSLLDKTSSLQIHDSGTIQYVMEFLSYCGKISCARLCHDLYQKYSDDTCRLSFAIVLEAYLETVKQEKDADKLLDIVEEVMNVLVAKWNKAKPTHRVDRLLQCAVVLNCLAVADMGKVSGMCESSELLVKRAMGGKGFATFWENVKSDKPNDENLYLPIANYLTQLYATSGTKSLEETASLLLQYTMSDSDGFNAMTNYPTRDACNAVLKNLLNSSQQENSTAANSNANYRFAQKILKFMFTKTEMGCTPDETTYDCFFSILEAANPKNTGIAADEWISFIETSNLFYVSSTFSLPRNIYCRALECYLHMVKNTDPNIVVDERHLPHRRAIHILRKLEIRSKPLVLNPAVLNETAVENLYSPNLRPIKSTYELVMQICANTSLPLYQEEAADIAIEIYHSMLRYNVSVVRIWEIVLENSTNEKLIEKLKELNLLPTLSNESSDGQDDTAATTDLFHADAT